MTQFKIFLLAIVGCLLFTACGSDGPEEITPGGDIGGDNPTPSGLDNVHNGTSSKPAYVKQI